MAVDVADHAVADADDVATHRLAEDLAVEGGDPLHVAGGDAEFGTDGVNGAVGHPAAGLLHYLERFYAGGTGIFVVVFLMFDGIALSLAQDEIALCAAACPLPLGGLVIVTLTLAHDLTFCGFSLYCASCPSPRRPGREDSTIHI
ncbi:hypothetical protein D3C80_1436660 [compost metagenome]